jgi:hypothetical protein
MVENSKHRWLDQMRITERDRFFLRGIAQAAWICLLGFAVIELVCRLLLRAPAEPLIAMLGQWGLGAVVFGLIVGWERWAKEEKKRQRSNEAVPCEPPQGPGQEKEG